MNGTPRLRLVIRSMEQLLQSPQCALEPDWTIQIRSCLAWAMDLDRYGATQTDLAELRQGLMSVCEFIRDNGEAASDPEVTTREDIEDVIGRVWLAAEQLRSRKRRRIRLA